MAKETAKKARVARLASLYIQDDSVTLAVGEPHDDGVALQLCDVLPVDKLDQLRGVFEQFATTYHLHNCPTQITLAPSYYQLLQIDQPKVGEKELANAAKWLVKDLIDFPVSEAVIGAFPVLNRPGATKKCTAVVGKVNEIAAIRSAAEQAEFDLLGIGITELTLNAILSQQKQADHGVGMVVLQPNTHLLCVSSEGILHFSRNLSVDYGQPILEKADELDKLALDIQRSLDYYQSHLQQPMPASVLLVDSGDDDEMLVEQINNRITIPLGLFDFSEFFILPDSSDQSVLRPHAVALAGLYVGRENAAKN